MDQWKLPVWDNVLPTSGCWNSGFYWEGLSGTCSPLSPLRIASLEIAPGAAPLVCNVTFEFWSSLHVELNDVYMRCIIMGPGSATSD